MEVKNNHAHVTTQNNLNKFIEINFSGMYGLAVMLSISTQTTSKNIDVYDKQFWPTPLGFELWSQIKFCT